MENLENTEIEMKTDTTTLPDKEEKKESFFKEIVKFALIAAIIVIPFRIYIAQPFMVNGPSMSPTFESGDYLIVDQITYRFFEEPKREDVVIFKYPLNPSKFFIKRIIGMPGDTVEIENGNIKVFNSDYPEGFEILGEYVVHQKNDNVSISLNDNEYFVMGDNRSRSSDSRSWGTLPRENIVGRPFVRLIPVTKISLFPGIQQSQ